MIMSTSSWRRCRRRIIYSSFLRPPSWTHLPGSGCLSVCVSNSCRLMTWLQTAV